MMEEQPFTTSIRLTTPARNSFPLLANKRIGMSIGLALMDAACLLLAFLAAVAFRFALLGRPIPEAFWQIALLMPLGVLVYMLAGLYNHNLSEVEELRLLTQSTLIFYLCLSGILFLVKQSESISRLAFSIACLLSLGAVPLGRELIRTVGVKLKFWGEPVVIFGNGLLGNEVAQFLLDHPKMGFIPAAVVDRRKVDRSKQPHQVIHDQDLSNCGSSLPECFDGIRTAFVVVPETSQNIHTRLIEEQTMQFERLILVTSSQVTSSLNVQPLDIGGILGLEVGHYLLDRGQMLTKRVMDLLAILISLPVTIPVFAIISLLIKFDSAGPVFYFQERIGYNGKRFKMWKFRSMHCGAEEMLCKYLAENPEAQTEWDETHKLKNDPRVTRVGKFLRKSSIDELPQLFNVLLGEMGLVGPRPIVQDEIAHYDRRYELYKHVVPGMTGMWQISGRSDTTYEQRVSLDEYYVRNWSIWLDAHILIRTFMVVLRGRGSY